MKKKFELAPLPYAYSALAPIISEETLHLHHDKHHRAYVDKLNELLPGSGFENDSLDDIVKFSKGLIFNQAAQHWNHIFYWNSMTGSNSRLPQGKLMSAFDKPFGSFSHFITEFEKMGGELFGSGWLWLTADAEGVLHLFPGKDADNPIRHGLTPLLACDLWEHAYYLDYKNMRPTYLARFFDIVNWEFAEKNYERGSYFNHPLQHSA